MTTSEAMRALSEALGWKCISVDYPSGTAWKLVRPDGSDHGFSLCFNGPDAPWQFGPNYLTSETDSAMLLDAMLATDGSSIHFLKMRTGKMVLDCAIGDSEAGWSQAEFTDRRTCVFLAALKWRRLEAPTDLEGM